MWNQPRRRNIGFYMCIIHLIDLSIFDGLAIRRIYWLCFFWVLIWCISSVLDFKISLGYQKAAQNEKSKHSIKYNTRIAGKCILLSCSVLKLKSQGRISEHHIYNLFDYFKTLFQFVPRRQCNPRII